MHKDTNKPNAMQIYLNIAEREYLRRSQRYEIIRKIEKITGEKRADEATVALMSDYLKEQEKLAGCSRPTTNDRAVATTALRSDRKTHRTKPIAEEDTEIHNPVFRPAAKSGITPPADRRTNRRSSSTSRRRAGRRSCG